MSKKKRGKKRFAVLIRVSTEQQAKQGESLRSQDRTMTDAVKQLGGVIAKRYAGYEHATLGHEKKLFNELLRDAARKSKLFDAVMVWDASRWSRDNVDSEKGLRILRKNQIEFYTLLTPHDLCDPAAFQLLQMSAVMNAGQAAIQTQKSIFNRIERAKRGIPSAGNLPFGRTFDKANGKWGLDEDKKAIIEDCAERYLNGEGMAALAREHGMNPSTLHDVLTNRCEPKFEVRFRKPEFNIDATIPIEVPELLDRKTRRAIKSKVAANKTYQHGKNKHDYLFSRMVFCGTCHAAMSGQYSQGVRYYRRAQSCKCFTGQVRADYLEDTVMRKLFDMFGNPEAVKEAIERSQPDIGKQNKLQERMGNHVANLKKIDAGRERLLRFVVKGTITDRQAEKQLSEIAEQERELRDKMGSLQAQIDHFPSSDDIGKVAQRHSKAMIRAISRWYDRMTSDQKRNLVETVFAGLTPDGKRMGVYVESIPEYEDRRPRHWAWCIQGNLVPDWEQEGDTTLNEDYYAFDPEQDLLPQDFVTSSGSYLPTP